MQEIRWTIGFDPSISGTITIVFLIVLLFALWTIAFKSPGRFQSFTRLGILTVVSLIFFDPHILREHLGPPLLIIVQDDSGSMDRPLDIPERTPFLESEEYLFDVSKRLDGNYRIEKRLLSDFSYTKEKSPLGDILLESSEKSPIAIILLSDGISNSGISFSEFLEHSKTPVFAVPFGSRKPPFDLSWKNTFIPKNVFLGDTVSIRTELGITGFSEPFRITVQLEEFSNENSDAKILSGEIREVAPGETSITLEFESVPEKEGVRKYRLNVFADPGFYEWNTDNNVFEFDISVHKDRLRVLLIEQFPRYEYRFLRELLRREHSIELRTLLLDAEPEYVEQDPIMISPEEPFDPERYQLVIFGDVDPERIGHAFLAELSDFVRKKDGSILFIAGERYMPDSYFQSPLGTLLPFQRSDPIRESEFSTDFPVEFRTEASAYIPGTENRENFSIRFLRTVPELKLGTTIIATADGKPFICARKERENYVFWHGSDETWLWREHDFYRDFWIGTLRFLSKSPKNDTEPNLFEKSSALMKPNEPDVGNSNGERENLNVDFAALRNLADSSGGMFVENRNDYSFLGRLPKGDPIVRETNSWPLPGRFIGFHVFLILLLLTWTTRSRATRERMPL